MQLDCYDSKSEILRITLKGSQLEAFSASHNIEGPISVV